MIIRQFREADATFVSELIRQNLKEINSKYYPPSVISKLVNFYSPERLIQRSQEHLILVAEDSDESIVGTATFNDEVNALGSVFVRPDRQHQGIGSRLIQRLEDLMKLTGKEKVTLHASLNAVEFYEKRGYSRNRLVDDEAFGKSYEMTKNLS